MSEDNFSRLEAKVDRVLEDLPEIKADLREHMRRTSILEKLHAEQQETTDARLKPLERSHFMWAGVGKAIAIALPVLAVLAAFLKVFWK